MRIVTAPQQVNIGDLLTQPTLFLAGSIDQGTAEEWQEAAIERCLNMNVLAFNPRREEWDENAPIEIVREQIEWELQALELANAIVMYFQPGSLSPISLLELGLYARDKNRKLVVICPEGFWRRVNVTVTCAKYLIPVYDDLDEGMTAALRLAKNNWAPQYW